MNISSGFPVSVSDASNSLKAVLATSPEILTHDEILKGWFAIAYLNPGLHPDESSEPDGGWPDSFRPLADEVWKRHSVGVITDGELYPADAQWLGIFDRIENPTKLEIDRMRELRNEAA